MFPSLAHQLAALGLFGADVAVRTVRIRLLVPGTPHPTLWQAITINAYGDAAAAVTPPRLGGDPARFPALPPPGGGASRGAPRAPVGPRAHSAFRSLSPLPPR